MGEGSVLLNLLSNCTYRCFNFPVSMKTKGNNTKRTKKGANFSLV